MKFIKYVLRNIMRSKMRSGLTIAGVAISIFMFCGILTISSSVKDMVKNSSSNQTLVVFQKNRY